MQTCQGVGLTCTLSGEGSIALLRAEGLVHLPSFYSGCQNGEEETEQDTRFTAEEAEIDKIFQQCFLAQNLGQTGSPLLY